MKKTLRGIAAIVASAMVASALGAVNAFADDTYAPMTLNDGSSASSKTSDVDLGLYKTVLDELAYTSTPTWSIEVTAPNLFGKYQLEMVAVP